MTNVYLAPLFQGDPCTWYVINFLLDSTIGLFIIYIGIQTCQYLAKTRRWDAINFGEYCKYCKLFSFYLFIVIIIKYIFYFSAASKSWVYQTWIYIGLMVIVKLITTLFIQMDFWDNVKNFILSPFPNPNIELIMVMLIIPFFVNVSILY